MTKIPSIKKQPYRPDLTTPFPELLSVEQIRDRLGKLFPEEYPDRGLLTGEMSARIVFVSLYGGFVEAAGRYLRPSFVYLFTEEQSVKVSDRERLEWTAMAHTGGFRPSGERWYADTSKEPIRDDLIRYQFLPMGAMGTNKPDDHNKTASTPIYFLRKDFADMFAPAVTENTLSELVIKWRHEHLSPSVLQRMTLRAMGAEKQVGDILVDLPNGERVRLSSGDSNLIVKALIEEFSKIHLDKGMVLWISASDKKSYPQFKELSESVGLRFDVGAELPDLILGSMGEPVTFYFCEVVASDGAITDVRKEALLGLIRDSKIQEKDVRFLSAFEDRLSAPFRKAFSKLATDSLVWFRTEPETVIIISTHTQWVAKS